MDALTGFSREIEHLDGHKVTIGSQVGSVALEIWDEMVSITRLFLQGVTKVGDYQYVPNEGMPVYNSANRFGNLFVYYVIEFPKALSDQQKKVVRELFPASK